MTIDLQFFASLVGGVAGIKLARMFYHRWRRRRIPGRPFSWLRVACLSLVVISMLIVALEL